MLDWEGSFEWSRVYQALKRRGFCNRVQVESVHLKLIDLKGGKKRNGAEVQHCWSIFFMVGGKWSNVILS